MNGKIVVRIVSALVLIAAIAGIGFFAFRAGVAQGSPVTVEAPSGESVPAPYPYYGYGTPFHRWHFGFGLGCFGILIPLFLFILVMKVFRMMVWGPRWGWGRHWEGGVPPMFNEWHKRSHGDEPEEKKE